jgi:hypothetical protein
MNITGGWGLAAIAGGGGGWAMEMRWRAAWIWQSANVGRENFVVINGLGKGLVCLTADNRRWTWIKISKMMV